MPFRDGFFPEQGEAIKSWRESLKMRHPDVIFTHHRDMRTRTNSSAD
jgi:hypothetical protein